MPFPLRRVHGDRWCPKTFVGADDDGAIYTQIVLNRSFKTRQGADTYVTQMAKDLIESLLMWIPEF